MNARGNTRTLLIRLLLALLITGYLPLAASAAGGNQPKGGKAPAGTQTPAGTPGASEDANEGTAWTIRENYFKRFKWAKEFGPEGSDRVNKDGESEGNGQMTVQGPIYKWPEQHEGSLTVNLPTKRDEAIGKHMVKTFGLPISDTQFQVMSRLNDNMMLEEAFDPERWMWMENTIGAIKSTSAANSAANLGRNQSQGAIEFAQNFLPNFTVDPSNVWNRIRNELFLPMALLLLLPGAVLSQVRAIVAQGTSVLGDVNPFDGIMRSIVAIFLIPATYLVVNYGIDVSNAITQEIGKGYERVFGGNMYTDAACAQRRAFPIRDRNSNKNQIPTTGTAPPPPPAGKENDPFAQLEAISFDVGASEQCGQNNNQQPLAGVGGGGRKLSYQEQRFRSAQGLGTAETSTRADKAPVTSDTYGSLLGSLGPQGQGVQQGLGDQGQKPEGQADDGKADEEQRVLMSTQRMVVNGANAALASTWNVLCAFQMAYLYYLFCIGPVVAALWVWPMNQLRGALPSWVEGVVTLCFWSLFWNTTILLMAAFKNVGETGTITMTALNFLATASVKHAFDFAGLVKDAGAQVGKEAEKAGKGGGGGKGNKAQGDHGSEGSDGGKGGKQPGQNSTDSSNPSSETSHNPASTSAMSLTPASSTSPGSTGDGGGASKGLTASDVVPPPGERNGSNDGGTGGTSGNTGGDGSTSQGGLAATEAPTGNGGNDGPAGSPPPTDGQSMAALAASGDAGPSGNSDPGRAGSSGDGGGPQSANASIDISGLTSSLAGSLGGIADGGAVPGISTSSIADSGISSSGGVLGLNGTGGTIDSGAVVPGPTNGFTRTGTENSTGVGLAGNQLLGSTVDARALGGNSEARGIDGSIVPGVGPQVPGNGAQIPGIGGQVPGQAGSTVPGVGPGLGVLADAGMPPVAGNGQLPIGATLGGIDQTPSANLAAIAGNQLSPPPVVAPVGADSIVAPAGTQSYLGLAQSSAQSFDGSPQAQAQPAQAQTILSQPEALPAQPEQFQASSYQAQPTQAQPIQSQPQQIQPEQYQFASYAQPVQAQPVQAQPQQLQPEQYQFASHAQPVQAQPVQAQSQQIQPDHHQSQPVQPQPIQAPAGSNCWTFQPIETPVSLAYASGLAAAAPASGHTQAHTPEHWPAPAPSQAYESSSVYAPSANSYAFIPAPAHTPAPASPAAPTHHHDSGQSYQANHSGSQQASPSAHTYDAPVDSSYFGQGARQGAGGGLAAALGRASAPRVPSNGQGNSAPANPTTAKPQGSSHRPASLQEQLGQSGIRNSRTPQRPYQGPGQQSSPIKRSTDPDGIPLR